MAKIQLKESQIQSQIINFLRCFPADIPKFWRQNTGGSYYKSKRKGLQYVAFGIKGMSDIIGWTRDGRFLAIEAKRPGRKASAEQARFLADLNEAGGIGILAYKMEDVKDRLVEEGYLKNVRT